MRRLVVVIMIGLFVAMIMSDLDVISLLKETKVNRESLKNHSYFHYLVLSKFTTEIVYVKFFTTISMTIFWVLQLRKPIAASALRRFTSYYVLFYVLFVYVVVSAIPIILNSVGSREVGVIELLSIIINRIGYINIITFAAVIITTLLLFLILPIVHANLSKSYEK
jgi:hypothetical protein